MLCMPTITVPAGGCENIGSQETALQKTLLGAGRIKRFLTTAVRNRALLCRLLQNGRAHSVCMCAFLFFPKRLHSNMGWLEWPATHGL